MSIIINDVCAQKPSMERVMTWLDFETLCLLFGMMVLVAILVDTGLFDWIALQVSVAIPVELCVNRLAWWISTPA